VKKGERVQGKNGGMCGVCGVGEAYNLTALLAYEGMVAALPGDNNFDDTRGQVVKGRSGL
jgi:hypothetical protein